MVLFFMKVGSPRSTWSSLFCFIPSSCSHLVLSFLMKDSLFIFIVVKHLDIDLQGTVEVIIVSWSIVEELSEHSDNLGKDIWL